MFFDPKTKDKVIRGRFDADIADDRNFMHARAGSRTIRSLSARAATVAAAEPM